MITKENIAGVIRLVRRETRKWREPVVERAARKGRDPYRTLISCILSLRTKDEVTEAASKRLFALADRPERIARLRVKTIEKAIYPVGFYRNKAAQIREMSKRIVDDFGGKVPASMEELLSLKGVGRKTANLVMTRGHDLHGICVDIHVHRICNRWGYVNTKSPNETEFALRGILPKRQWKEINGMLVAFGQNLCRPLSPFCSRCPLDGLCAREGVGRSR